MTGNTSDNTTLADFLTKIEDQYGRSDRGWIMDRGIPTEETLEAMRKGDTPICTPKGRLTRLEKSFLEIPWQEVRQSVDVKLLTNDGELFVLVRSERRVLKERSMRRRRLKKLWKRLGELRRQSNRRDTLMLKLGAAKKDAGRAWSSLRSMSRTPAKSWPPTGSPTACVARNCAKCFAARAATCCART